MSCNLSDDLQKAKTHALKIIGMRDQSGGEILKKLGKHYEPEVCNSALEWLRELGYQNDEKYAEKLAAHLIKNKNFGLRKIKYEMRLKGLSEDIIDTALEIYDGEQIIEIIIELIGRKYLHNLNDYAGIKKTVDALMRRGYDYSDIKTAVATIKEGLDWEYEE